MRITIKEGERGILWGQGIIKRTLEPGRHRYSLIAGERVDRLSCLAVDYLSQTQEYTTVDNLTVRFFVRARIGIDDPLALVRTVGSDQLQGFVVNTLSDEARRIVLSNTLDNLLAISPDLSDQLVAACAPIFKRSGLSLESVSPISLLIPRSLRQAFEAEVAAKKRAIADLEEARGRTATLRHLANAADMVEKRPVLLQLLIGQKARNVQFQFDKRQGKE